MHLEDVLLSVNLNNLNSNTKIIELGQEFYDFVHEQAIIVKVKKAIHETVSEQIPIEQDTKLVDLGIDSLDLLQLPFELERVFKRRFNNFPELTESVTVQDFITYIKKEMQNND